MNVRTALAKLALVLAIAPTVACTFGTLPHELRDPVLAAVPPCFSGQVCGVPFDGFGFSWTVDALEAARR